MPEEAGKSDQLAILKRQRGNVKGNITRIKNLLESTGTKWSPIDLECRLEILASYMEQVMSYQTQIETIDPEDDRRAEIEELCIATKSKLLTLLGKNRRKESSAMDSTFGVALPPPTRLPNLKLPSFSGKYCNYKNFISSFNNLIHEEPTLSSIEKFNHLLSCLTGDALRTVQAFQVTDDNYHKALARLAERYDKKTLIFFDNIENLFDIPKMSNPDASALRNAVDTVSAIFGSLQSLGSHVEIINALIIHLVLSKVDHETKARWNEQLDYSILPSWDNCANILIRRSQSLEVNEDKATKSEKVAKKKDKTKNRAVFNCSQSSKEKVCLYCKSLGHIIQDCGNFTAVSVADRFDFAKKNSCCLNCLKVGHVVAKCRLPRCKICKRPHHELLHRYELQPHAGGIENGLSTLPSTSSSAASRLSPMHVAIRSTVILATAVVHVRDRCGAFQPVRALLDSGSQLNLITEECSRRLKLKRKTNFLNLNGVGSVNLKSNHKVNATVKSRVNSYEFQDEFSVLETISTYQPENDLVGIEEKIPSNIPLADPQFAKCQKIDMLIGTDVFFEILSVGQIKLGEALPKLQKTLLGWIIAGKTSTAVIDSIRNCALIENDLGLDMEALDIFVNKFWEIEELPNRCYKFTEQHLKCENHFKENVIRLNCGRFVVKLPFKESPSILGSSFEVASRRFLSLERRLSKTANVKDLYTSFMEEYISLGHMTEVKSFPTGHHYFIPHQCVLRPESTTTKLRVVFDASCRTSSQVSLNEILMVGPTIQPELYSALLRFRCYKFAMTADITKMYRQVMMSEENKQYQLILWRKNENMSLRMFHLNTVTYGTAPAPFLAIRCLKELSDHNSQRYPIGSRVIHDHFYVDDLLTGADTVQELETIKNEVVSILKSGCFELAKWHCNVDEMNINQMPGKQLVTNEIDATKTLGMTWFSKEDYFQFKIRFEFESMKATKRNILALSARLFDPLGLISPIILQAKILLQELWRQKLDWDESVPMAIETSWQQFKLSLINIEDVKIPRFVNTKLTEKVQIHGFADASEDAYGCCLYIRARVHDKVIVRLLTAKSKVAPLKKKKSSTS